NGNLDLRLPKTIIPVSYNIILTPTLKNGFKFEGTTMITAFVQEDTDTIILHHGTINIYTLTVTVGDTRLEHQDPKYDSKTEKISIKLNTTLKKGMNISINFFYGGVLREDMIGFYRSSYIDSTGNIRWIAATQFQTKHARHAFPCFDEPSFKATFKIRISRPTEYKCLSNMPRKTTEPSDPGEEWDIFEESIPMSTYLVAFVISDFDSLKDKDFSVWARPNAKDQAEYALNIGPRALKYFSTIFKQEYQLSKMDMVAVPDFSAGAMENWGLVTYRESRMLYDKATSSDAAKQSVAAVIVHELTHMWFGNQITPEWWSYLWLSEAFARYFQYFATAQIEESWNMEDQFIVDQCQTAFAADGLESSEPMTRDVVTSSQLGGVGDTITYNKGASIVRMMNLVFGNAVFETGLQNYLRNNKEAKVARPENLWIEIQDELNLRNEQLPTSVEKIMSTWTEQSGFPVLNVAIENGVAKIHQSRFLLRNLKSTPTNLTWWVPITWASKDKPNFDKVVVPYWLNKQEDTFQLGTGPGWVVLNVQSAGFYRVNYDRASWYHIIEVLDSRNYQDIPTANRAAIIDDLLNLARSGLLDYEIALDGLQYIKRERNYLPFKSAFSGFTYLDRRFSGHNKFYTQFKTFVLDLIKDVYENLGYVDRAGDDRLTVLLRTELNKWACKYGHPGCVDTFTKLFQEWKKNPSLTITPNQRPTAYCTAIRNGTKDDWEFLWNQYYNSNSAADQAVILQALGCTEDTSLWERYLLDALKSFEKSRIRRQDSTSVFSAISGSGRLGAEFILDFVEKYHTTMSEYYSGPSTISSILSSASQGFSTQGSIDKFEKLIKTHPTEFKDILDSLNNSLKIAKYELLWFNKYGDAIISWIDKSVKFSEDYRLPTKIEPLTYFIHLKPKINALNNKFSFDGTVKIAAKVTESTNVIVLHSSDLVHETIIVSANNKNLTITKTETTKKYDFLTIELDEELKVGEAVDIQISFSGTLNDEMRGFYKTWYYDDNGQRRWLAATHLEPVGARKVFPCFDEPALKANFTMEVVVAEGYSALSNTGIESIIRHSNYEKTITFKETPKMSTYLVVLVVSDFFGITDSGIYGVWARPNARSQMEYGLSIMKPLVQFYENTLNDPYQLKKLDMVALPDFVAGAMENWGLLTYKERNLLYSPEESTTATQQSITTVVSHEIAHQWFGNMVSPAWWKYVWLNEGFARYFETFATASVVNWNLESQFVVDHVHSALEVDSSSSSHAMTHDVSSPTEISGLFDTISYAKAASVIRMMRASFGDTVFYNSLHRYLRNRRYSTATPEDLFDAFKQEISDTGLKNLIYDIMNSWTTQPGYPVVHVSIQGNSVKLQQKRFLIDKEKANSDTSLWYVPITWTSLYEPDFNNTAPKYWLNTAEGFYRTNYDTDYWRRIIDFLKSKQYTKIHEINRATIIDDLWNFGRAGHVDYEIVLSATQYLVNETDYIPLKAFFKGLTFLRRHVQGRDADDAYKQYVARIVTPIYNRIGDTDTKWSKHELRLLKMLLRKWVCQIDAADCKANSLDMFKNWQNGDSKKIPPNFRSAVYCEVVKLNDFSKWNTIWTLLLHTAIEDNGVIRREDSSTVFSNIIEASLEGVDYVMDFIKANYIDIVEYYRGPSQIHSIVNTLAKRVTTEELLSKYTELISWLAIQDPIFRISLNSYQSIVEQERTWAEKNVPKIHAWIETNYQSTSYRLPKTFTPLKYNIYLAPYFEEKNFQFVGKVQIEMKRLMSTSRIVLNSHELDVTKVSVYNSNGNLIKGEELVVSNLVTNKETQMLKIFMKEFIKSQNIIVEIEYVGYLNEKMQGFYRSYYQNDDGTIQYLATTQFEPTYARKAFPCFDEPAYKAPFIINIQKPVNSVALSNMPSLRLTSSDVSGHVWETFQETVKMSSYLVAFVVSDFKPVREESTAVNVWSRPKMAETGDFAQIAAQRMLDYLSLETGYKYTLPKLDLIAIPDFSMGAMENWGLATFREYALHYDKDETSATYTDYIITIIAHELSHMWFGNLVTCDWWEYTWLNEGFAEYMQWVVSNQFRPSHEFDNLFVVNELQNAMQNDNFKTSHPMNQPVSKPSEISNVFDSIAYGKASSVIRMIHRAFGPNIFKNAINRYLKRHQYSTATPKDLWNAFDEAINETRTVGDWHVGMEELMDSWVNKAGYPVVTASLDKNTITLTQERFPARGSDSSKVSYWIPITVTSSTKPDFITTETNIWMGASPQSIYLPNATEWFVVNVQQSGYYRVNYDNISWERLKEALDKPGHSQIHVTNRAQIVDDALNLARAGYINYGLAFNCITYLTKEVDYLPWKAFFNGMSYIIQRFEGQDGYELLQRHIVLLTSNMFEELGYVDSRNDTHSKQLKRELILTWACKMGNTRCVDFGKEWFADFKARTKNGLSNRISPNARAAVYSTAIRSGTYEDWEFLWQHYLKTEFATEKKIILDALGCTTNKTLLNMYISRALNHDYTSDIRKQDVNAVLASIYGSGQLGFNVMLDFLITNYQSLYAFYGNWGGVGSLLSKLASRTSNEDQLKKIKPRTQTYYSLSRAQLFLRKLNAKVCPMGWLETELSTRATSCFLIPEFSVIVHSKYRLSSHVSLVQPSALNSRSFSEPTFVSRYLCQAKSHSVCPPTRMAVQ
ncbi:Aminopeptidase N, partial [Dufourea novaeangliae]